MAIKNLVMANIVCPRDRLDETVRDMILLEKCEFIDTFLEINEGDFSIGISEENADEILDMEDIVPLKENKEIKQVIQKFETTMMSLNYKPIVHKKHMHGEHDFEKIKADVEQLCLNFENQTNEVLQINQRIEELKNLEVLECMKNIDIDMLELSNLKYFTLKFGFLTREKAKRISQNYDNIKAIVLHVGTYEEKEVNLILSPKSLDVEMGRILRSTNFVEIDLKDAFLSTPKAMIEHNKNELSKYQKRLNEIQETTQKDIKEKSELMDVLYSKLIMESRIDQVRTKVAVTENFAYLSSWIPEGFTDKMDHALQKPPDMLVTYKKSSEVSLNIPVPTFLKNNAFFKPFEMLVNMYGVPSHNEADPTIFFGLAYVILFGAMFGDLGQGMVFVLAGILIRNKVSADFSGILTRIGIGSMIFGVIYDSFFGYENIISSILPLPIYLRPMENINTMLIASIVLGVILVFVSYGYSIVNKLRLGDLEEGVFGRNGINGLVMLTSILLLVLKLMTGISVIPSPLLLVLILMSIALLVFKQPISNKIKKEERLYEENASSYYIESGFNLFETFLSIISNTISFIRVGAFALNHVGLFIAFHTLASMIGNTGGNITMFFLGNIIIIGLEGLVVFIQGLRLFYYELFSKYYTGDGVLFTPDKL
ncbi:V-type ATP synthase subunit I [Fusibacter bizertensis]